MSKKLLAAIAMLAVFMAGPAKAGNAELLLSPTRVVLENGAKFATVTVRNSGDGTGRYKIETVDTAMDENGGIRILEGEAKAEYSAKDLISLSPRSMTLRPDENQPIRILIKNSENLPDGEYRSHLQVRMTENDLDADTGKPNPQGANIVLKPKMTTVIPVIIRKGATDYKIGIDEAKLTMAGPDGKQTPAIRAVFSLSGNRSVLSDLKVTHVAQDGKETQLAFFRGIAIYRGVAKRAQSVALDVPAGVNIHAGRLSLALMSQEGEGSKVLATKEITP